MSNPLTLDPNNNLTIPTITPYTPQPRNCLGKIVEWIRGPQDRCTLAKVLVYALTFIISGILFASIVGIPLILKGVSENARQQEENRKLSVIADLEENYEQIREVTVRLSGEVQNRDSQIQRLNTNITPHDQEVIQRITGNHDVVKRALDKTIVDLTNKNYSLKEENEKLKKQTKDQLLGVKRLATTVNELSEQNQKLNQTAIQNGFTRHQASLQVKELTTQLQKFKEENNELDGQLIAHKKWIEKHNPKKELTDLTMSNNLRNKALELAAKENHALKSENESLKDLIIRISFVFYQTNELYCNSPQLQKVIDVLTCNEHKRNEVVSTLNAYFNDPKNRQENFSDLRIYLFGVSTLHQLANSAPFDEARLLNPLNSHQKLALRYFPETDLEMEEEQVEENDEAEVKIEKATELKEPKQSSSLVRSSNKSLLASEVVELLNQNAVNRPIVFSIQTSDNTEFKLFELHDALTNPSLNQPLTLSSKSSVSELKHAITKGQTQNIVITIASPTNKKSEEIRYILSPEIFTHNKNLPIEQVISQLCNELLASLNQIYSFKTDMLEGTRGTPESSVKIEEIEDTSTADATGKSKTESTNRPTPILSKSSSSPAILKTLSNSGLLAAHTTRVGQPNSLRLSAPTIMKNPKVDITKEEAKVV